MDTGNPFVIKNYTELSLEEHTWVLEARNSPPVKKFMFDQNNISMDQHLAFIERLKTDQDKFYYGMFKEGVYCGSIYITGVTSGKPFCGNFTAPQFFESPVGIEIFYYGLGFLIRKLGLTKVYGETLPSNKSIQRIVLKFGFELLEEKANNFEYILETGKWQFGFTTGELFKFIVNKKAHF